MRMILGQVPFFVLALLLFGLSTSANADNIALVFDNFGDLADGLDDGDTVSAGGVAITFSNVVVPNGGPGEVTGVGILMSGATDQTFADVIQFDFSFNDDVYLNTYEIGSWESVALGSFMTISGPNGTSGNNQIPDGDSNSEQSFAFDQGSIPYFAEGQVYTLTHNLTATGDPLFYLEEFSVSVVPEPASGMIIMLATIGFCRHRRRN